MKIDFRQGVVSHQATGFLESNGTGGVRIAASTRSTTITLAHHDTNYTHSEDNNVEAAWPGPFPAGDNYYLYWDFNPLTFLRTFGYTILEPVSQSVAPGAGNSPIVGIIPGVASPVANGSFEVEGHYVLATGKEFAVIGSTGSPNNDGTYTVQSAVYNLISGNTTITVNEAVIAAAASGELTLDIDSSGNPLFVQDRHWYDTENNIHYVLDGSNQWVEVLRVFAANLFNGTTFISMSQTGDFTGTQIGDNSSIASGRVLFGDVGTPIQRDNKTFLTTEDQFFTNQSRVDAIRLESNVTRAQAFSSSIAQFNIVAWRDDGKIDSATYDDTSSTVVGVLTESLLVGETGAVITQGSVTNSAWDWTSTLSVGVELWIQDGLLVGIDPFVSDPSTYPIKRVPVARVLSVDTVIFEQGLGGIGPTGPAGAVDGLAIATTTELGAVFISPAPDNELLPIAVGTNHPNITGSFAAVSHTHTASQISFTPGNDIIATDVQNAISELAVEKLNITGGSLTGFLTLSATPTNNFHATTKAYVDSIASGLDAKLSVIVTTTSLLGDIGGTYSPTGGTGGTGNFTTSLISKLDGVIGTDYYIVVDSRILIKNQLDAKQNGIYVVTALGAGSPPTTMDLERSEDFDEDSEVRAGSYTFTRAGLTQAGNGYVLTDIHTGDDIVLNSHDIIWTQVSAIKETNWLTANNEDNFVIAPVAAIKAIALGNGATAPFAESIAIGNYADTGSVGNAIAIGYKAETGGGATASSIAIGDKAYCGGLNPAIAIGDEARAFGTESIVIGRLSYTNSNGSRNLLFGGNNKITGNFNNDCLLVGRTHTAASTAYSATLVGAGNTSSITHQVCVGIQLNSTVVTSDVTHSVKLGYGLAGTNKNVLHLFDKGKLELYGDQAQFIVPKYATASEPTNPLEGSLIYDSTLDVLKTHDGVGWNAVGGSSFNWLTANNGVNFTIAPTASGSSSIALGDTARATAVNGIAIGDNSYAWSTNAVSIGPQSDASTNAVAIGNYASAYQTGGCIAIGERAQTTTGTTACIAIGRYARATSDCIAIGETALANTSSSAVSIGKNSHSDGEYSVAIGVSAVADSSIAGRSVAIGFLSNADRDYHTAIGNNLNLVSSFDYAVKIGYGGADTNQNYLHLHSKGKFELHGEEAQYILPNYLVGSPPLPAIPLTTADGGMIWDASIKEMKIYDGSNFVSNPSPDLGEFTVAGLPVASSNINRYALATNASGGRTIVRSDGTNWKVVVVEGATVTI